MESSYAAAWERVCATPGVLRNIAYAETQRRTVGPSGLTVQFCDNHIKTKRPPSTVAPTSTPASVTATSPVSGGASTRLVSRPFDAARFNFNKAHRNEVVAEVSVDEDRDRLFLTYVAGGSAACQSVGRSDVALLRQHPLFVNVSPLFDDHSLLVPYVSENHPQVMTARLLREVLVVAGAFAPSSGWRFGFNSLGAWASVNHFHVHCGRAAAVFPGGLLPIERAGRTLISAAVIPSHRAGGSAATPTRITLSSLDDYGLPGFVFSVAGAGDAAETAASGCAPSAVALASSADAVTPSAALSPVAGAAGGAGALPASPAALPSVQIDPAAADALAACAGALLEGLVARDVPHTLSICDGGRTVFVLPRKPQHGAGAEAGELVVAMAEACGLGIVYSAEDFETYTEERYRAKLAEAALADDVMRELRELAVACMSR